MTWTLCRKLLRDLRVALIAVALFLGLFQVLWAKVTERILGRLAPLLNTLAGLGGLTPKDMESMIFEGPGKIVRTIMGGEQVRLDTAMDMLTIGYVHPLMQILFCVWAIGRAAGAFAGEIDRGTMELLLSQPVPRSRLVLAHFLVDLATIPLLCLSLWAGNWVGAAMISPIRVEDPKLNLPLPPRNYLLEIGPIKLKLDDPTRMASRAPTEADREALHERLRVEPRKFAPALLLVGGLVFAVCGPTMWLSAAGRSRWRVLGIAVFVALLQFLVNILGQMWDQVGWLRPFTVFYYYQPQQLILSGNWSVPLTEWSISSVIPMPLVLFGVGLFGYAMALWTLVRRDLPAPL